MSFGVPGGVGGPSGPGGPQGAQSGGQQAQNVVQAAVEASQDALLIFDSEAQAVDKKMIGQDKAQADQAASMKSKQDAQQAGRPEVAAAYASEMTDEVEKKKRKKKLTKWEEKMEELENLEGVVKEEDVQSDEEKGVIREFFDNMRKIKKLRRELKQAEQKRQHYERLLEEQKRQEQGK